MIKINKDEYLKVSGEPAQLLTELKIVIEEIYEKENIGGKIMMEELWNDFFKPEKLKSKKKDNLRMKELIKCIKKEMN